FGYWGSAVGIATCGIVPRSSRTGCKPDVEGIEEDAVGIVRVDVDSLVVPVLRVVARAVLAVSERAARRTLHEGPVCTTVRGSPGADLAASGAATTAVAITNNRLCLC